MDNVSCVVMILMLYRKFRVVFLHKTIGILVQHWKISRRKR